MRARFAVAILSLALIYASTCSATCAICLGAVTPAAAHSNACDHAAPDAPGGAPQRCPAKPDCAVRHHSGFEVVRSYGLAPFQLSAAGHGSALLDGVVRTDVVNVGFSFLSDLAPPLDDAVSPRRTISILRI